MNEEQRVQGEKNRIEFENPSTTRERRIELVQWVAEMAEANDNYNLRCMEGEKVFFVAHDEALIPGHIYSQDGKAEFHISGMCEFHFDEYTLPDD